MLESVIEGHYLVYVYDVVGVVCLSPEPGEDVLWAQAAALQFPGLLTQTPCAKCG